MKDTVMAVQSPVSPARRDLSGVDEPRRASSDECDIEHQVKFTLEEGRMVLPGVQTLFGFQLIAIFSERFDQVLSPSEQRLHLAALTLVCGSVALLMTPAAYHRQRAPHAASRGFVSLSTKLITVGLVPLMLGLTLDLYVVSHMVLQRTDLSALIAALALMLFVALWFVLPRVRGSR